MQTKRKRYSAEFKAKVALEAIREQKTMSELSSQYSLHPTQIGLWKKHLLETAAHLFQEAVKEKKQADQIAPEQLYQQIGQLQVELNWLKKKSSH